MAYKAKCPSCGTQYTLQEAHIGSKVSCAKCKKVWVFDEPIKRRNEAKAAAGRAEVAQGRPGDWLLKLARSTAGRADRKRPQYLMLSIASACCYGFACVGVVPLVLGMPLFEPGSVSGLGGVDGKVVAFLVDVLAIVYLGATGSALAALRDMAINSWKLVNKE